MRTITDNAELTPFFGGVFVPTMGGLHEGHAALVRHAAAIARNHSMPVVVSVFVNPTQFDDPADYLRYPRDLATDAAICNAAGADVVFAPSPDAVYPADEELPTPLLPMVGAEPGLEDLARPGHFAGVCQVIARLFTLVHPVKAVFGEKDWQQLQVVSAMTAQEQLGVEIVPAATVREADGLAMSSRNRFLPPEDRGRAAAVYASLQAAGRELSPQKAESAMQRTLTEAGLIVDYAAIRDAATLGTPGIPSPSGSPGSPHPNDSRPMRAIVAARLGGVRLLDNAPWPMP